MSSDPRSGAASAPETIDGLVSQVRKDGRPVVRMSCAYCGDHWLVECQVYPVGELTVAPKVAGPYVFTSGAEARRFIDESLLALQIFGCEVAV